MLQKTFAHKSSKFLAEMSYSVYIIHLILMLPFFAFILKEGEVGIVYWWAASIILLAMTLVFSRLIYRYIEIPGINLDKN